MLKYAYELGVKLAMQEAGLLKSSATKSVKKITPNVNKALASIKTNNFPKMQEITSAQSVRA